MKVRDVFVAEMERELAGERQAGFSDGPPVAFSDGIQAAAFSDGIQAAAFSDGTGRAA
jgi:hypothetical protein